MLTRDLFVVATTLLFYCSPMELPKSRNFEPLLRHDVTPQHDGLATPQRELTRKSQTVRFNVILLMWYSLITRTRRHSLFNWQFIEQSLHMRRYIFVDSDLYRIICCLT